MQRATAYRALSKALEGWARLPVEQLRTRVGRPPEVHTESIGGEQLTIEIAASWSDGSQDAVRIYGVVNGPSHWRLERLEESVLVRTVSSD